MVAIVHRITLTAIILYGLGKRGLSFAEGAYIQTGAPYWDHTPYYSEAQAPANQALPTPVWYEPLESDSCTHQPRTTLGEMRFALSLLRTVYLTLFSGAMK